MKIAHICLYPGRGEKHIGESGVASYTKNLISHLPIDGQAKHYILCNRVDAKNEQYDEAGVTVIRCFDRTWRYAWKLHHQLKMLRPDVVHIQHELSLFGGLVTAYLLPILVFLWRRKAVITLHGVVDPSQVTKDFVRANGYGLLPAWLVKLGLFALYWPLAHWPKRVIVHELYFKQVLLLRYGVRANKVAVIAHGVEDFVVTERVKARQQLGLSKRQKVVLFMGYAAGYKGIDRLIEGFAHYAKSEPEAYLILGAGAHPKFKNNAAYQAVYNAYQHKAAELIPAGQYRWVGFIPEHDVATYYSAADVSVYPYTMALASSGPMSFAIGFNKPFLASRAFAAVFNNDLVFDAAPQDMAAKLHDFFSDTARFDHHIARLRAERLWPHIGAKTTKLYEQISEAYA